MIGSKMKGPPIGGPFFWFIVISGKYQLVATAQCYSGIKRTVLQARWKIPARLTICLSQSVS